MNDKQILITGATNGIGLAAAEALAALGANVGIVGRSKAKTRIASARIRAAAGRGPTVATFIADLSSQAEVRRLAAEVLDRYLKLDVLINNAGAMYGTRQLTKDGIELTWAVNHLAPFLLSKLLLHRLKESASARIITTASQAHQGAHIPFDDLNAERSYRGFGRYCETKLANILFTTELARRLDGTQVTANCFHPGFVATGFNRNNGLLMNLGMTILSPVARSPEKGAKTLVWLATSPVVANVSGVYFFDQEQTPPSPDNYDTLVCDFGQAGDDPALSKDSAPPWRGFLWRPRIPSSSESSPGAYLGPQVVARGRRSQQPFAGTNRPDRNCLVTEEPRTIRDPQPRSPGRGFSFCVASQSATAGRDDRRGFRARYAEGGHHKKMRIFVIAIT